MDLISINQMQIVNKEIKSYFILKKNFLELYIASKLAKKPIVSISSSNNNFNSFDLNVLNLESKNNNLIEKAGWRFFKSKLESNMVKGKFNIYINKSIVPNSSKQISQKNIPGILFIKDTEMIEQIDKINENPFNFLYVLNTKPKNFKNFLEMTKSNFPILSIENIYKKLALLKNYNLNFAGIIEKNDLSVFISSIKRFRGNKIFFDNFEDKVFLDLHFVTEKKSIFSKLLLMGKNYFQANQEFLEKFIKNNVLPDDFLTYCKPTAESNHTFKLDPSYIKVIETEIETNLKLRRLIQYNRKYENKLDNTEFIKIIKDIINNKFNLKTYPKELIDFVKIKKDLKTNIEINQNKLDLIKSEIIEAWNSKNFNKLLNLTVNNGFKEPFYPSERFVNSLLKVTKEKIDMILKSNNEVTKIVYTTDFGNYDNLEATYFDDKNIIFLRLTDQKNYVHGWKNIFIKNNTSTSDLLFAKIFKVLSHHFLPKYIPNLFIDANTVITGQFQDIFEILSTHEFFAFNHPVRSSLIDEAIAIIQQKKYCSKDVLKQLSVYSNSITLKEANNIELKELSFIFRNNISKKISKAMDDWWKHNCNYTSRDQLSFAYLAQQNDFKIHKCDKLFKIQNSRNGIFFFKKPHITKLKKPILLKSKIRVHFCTPFQNLTTGTSIMRTRQLASLLKNFNFPNSDRFEFRSGFDNSTKGGIIILSKHFRGSSFIPIIDEIRNWYDFVIMDLNDEGPVEINTKQIDGFIASSYTGHKMLLSRGFISHLIYHHSDERASSKKKTRFISYIGDESNYLDVGLNIEKYFLNTRNVNKNLDFLQFAGESEVHYCFRNKKIDDFSKPFTKALLAAKSNAVVFCSKKVDDALELFGTNHPFMTETDDPKEIEDMYKFIKNSYGKTPWNLALKLNQQLLKKTSNVNIVNQTLQMIRYYIST